MDKLGRALVAGAQVTDEDLDKLASIVDAYQQVLDQVKVQLTDLGYAATTRVKTTGTLVDKLRRERPMRLSQVQDMAGARIVVGNRRTQDEAVETIRRTFESLGNSCRRTDRREDPSHGYRAVHLIVQVGGILVEIQVRTELQDAWAQIVERLADRWGRGIRYGEEPDLPDAMVWVGTGPARSRREAMRLVIGLSDLIAATEVANEHFGAVTRTLTGDELVGQGASLAEHAREREDLLRDILQLIATATDGAG